MMKLRWWHKHVWSKWVAYSVLAEATHEECGQIVFVKKVQLRQRRECIDCGFTEDKAVAYTNNEKELR
jgi:hypothetical protein